MSATYNKILFELQLKHAAAPAELCTAFGIFPLQSTLASFRNFRMRYRTAPGKITVYYSGNEIKDSATPPNRTLVPFPAIADKTIFDFGVQVLDRTIINNTRIPASVITDEGKVIHKSLVKPGIAAVQFGSDAATSGMEQFSVYNNAHAQVNRPGTLVAKDDNGKYNCTADLSGKQTGIYTFELGTASPAYYVDVNNELNDAYGFIRLTYKESGAGAWLKPTAISPHPVSADYNIFDFTFQSL